MYYIVRKFHCGRVCLMCMASSVPSLGVLTSSIGFDSWDGAKSGINTLLSNLGNKCDHMLLNFKSKGIITFTHSTVVGMLIFNKTNSRRSPTYKV